MSELDNYDIYRSVMKQYNQIKNKIKLENINDPIIAEMISKIEKTKNFWDTISPTHKSRYELEEFHQ